MVYAPNSDIIVTNEFTTLQNHLVIPKSVKYWKYSVFPLTQGQGHIY